MAGLFGESSRSREIGDMRDRRRRGGALSLLLLAALQLGGEGVASRAIHARRSAVAPALARSRLAQFRATQSQPRMVALERANTAEDPNILTAERPLKVMIAGAGIGGMLLANGLAKIGAEVCAAAP